MKITVLTGSPRRNGNSNFLAQRFIQGAQEAGHEIYRFDCATHKLDGCMACSSCDTSGPCVLKDDFEMVWPHLLDADMIVLVSPMYYFGISAQLKRVLDRFYAINTQLMGQSKKSAFMLTCASTSPDDAQPMLLHYQAVVNYLGWQDKGTVVALGVWNTGDIISTPYGEQAYRLGKSL